MKKHLKIKFSLFDAFCLILKIKQKSPLGFVRFHIQIPLSESVRDNSCNSVTLTFVTVNYRRIFLKTKSRRSQLVESIFMVDCLSKT